MASNKYLINCLVLVQPDFEINEVLNSFIIVCVRCGGGGGVAIEWGCLVILGSHFFGVGGEVMFGPLLG